MAFDPGKRIGILKRGIAAALREAGDATEDRAAGNGELGQDSGGRRDAIEGGRGCRILREGDEDAVQARAEFVRDGGRKDVRVTERKQFALRRARITEAGQIVALERGFGALVAIRDEIGEEEIALAEVVIEAAGELVEAARAAGGSDEKVSGGVIGFWQQRKQSEDDRIRDGGDLRGGGDLRFKRRDFPALAAFVACEKERAVADDGAADAVSIDVALEGDDVAAGVEIIFGIELFVADEFISGAVEAVGAGLRDGADDDAGVAAVIGTEGVGLDLELLDHVNVGLERDLVLRHVAEVDAIEQVIRGVFAGAGGVNAGDADAAGDGEEGPVVGARRDGALSEQRDIEKKAAVERDFDNLAVGNDFAQGCGFGLDAGAGGFDGEEAGDVADLHDDIEARAVGDGEGDLGPDEGFEAALFGLELIAAGLDKGEFVFADGVGLGGEGDASVVVGESEGDVGHGGVFGVLNAAGEGGVLGGQGKGE